MSMLTTFEAMKKTLAGSAVTCSSCSPYAQARAHQPALAEYATPGDVLAALAPSSLLDDKTKNLVVAALVEEAQARPSATMNALLAVAFEPMLVRLRARLGAKGDTDRDAELLLAFFEVVRTTQARVFTMLCIRWATQEKVFAPRRARANGPEIERANERESDPIDHENHAKTGDGALADIKLEVSEILDEIEAEGGTELMLAVLAADVGNEPMTDHVARVHAGQPEDQRARIYDRLVRARAGLFARMRAQVRIEELRAA